MRDARLEAAAVRIEELYYHANLTDDDRRWVLKVASDLMSMNCSLSRMADDFSRACAVIDDLERRYAAG